MKAQIKSAVKAIICFVVKVSSKTQVGRYLHSQIVNAAMEQVLQVAYRGSKFKFAVPNWLCHWRVKTFSTKEPETLDWIDAIPDGAVFWDVGANVGLYSVYAAQKRNCRVWAFEPSVFNLELLARNIVLNGASDRICLVPLALSDGLGPSQMHMTTTDWGGALSTFGQDHGWDGKAIRQVFEFQTMGLSMEDVVQRLGLPQPDYVKMDVDGIEHVILKGGRSVLGRVEGVLIEINDDFHEQAEQCQQLLSEAGLVLKEKRHSEIIKNSTMGFQNTYNQIWVRH